ncbi:MAG: hypothetical protein E6J27_09685 [Chloroflexi bacterium]|nr:MAG: hypothetical protein E6J27_09685 [Chloroflexota bacterium]
MRTALPTTSSAPPTMTSRRSRRRSPSVVGGWMNSRKNPAPRMMAMPANVSARPASSSALGGGADGPMSGIVGRGALPTTKANAPFVSWPSTAERAVHETR